MRFIYLVDLNVDKIFRKKLLDLKLNCLTFYSLHAEDQKVENVWKKINDKIILGLDSLCIIGDISLNCYFRIRQIDMNC